MKPHVIKIARNDFAKWYGIDLDNEQLESILNQDAELLKVFERYRKTATGFDTFDREALPDLLCRYLKIDKSWPSYGDSNAYSKAFFEELMLCCEAAGIKIHGA